MYKCFIIKWNGMSNLFILETVLKKKNYNSTLAIQVFVLENGEKAYGYFVNDMQVPVFYYYKKDDQVKLYYDTEVAQKVINEEDVHLINYDLHLLDYQSFIRYFEISASQFFKLPINTSVFNHPGHIENFRRLTNLYNHYSQSAKVSKK